MPFGKKVKVRKMTQKDIDEGLEELFKGQRKVGEETKGAPIQRRENIKRAGSPKLTFEPEPEPEPEENEPYWDGSEWEQWAYSMYKNYPDTRQFLPDWFIEAIKEATSN